MSISTSTPPTKGRPDEIEERLNRALIHPLSRRLTTLLIPTGASPNLVSALGVVMAALAAAAYATQGWPWPLSALLGFILHLGWHVFDGADGDLARRTGRSSPSGEVVDGVCDYLSHIVIYVVLAAVLARSLGAWAWLIATVAGLSRALQANHYESARRNYQWWVYGAPWIGRTHGAPAPSGPGGSRWRLRRGLTATYLWASSRVSADSTALDALHDRLAGSANAQAARRLYAEAFRPVVKQAAWLGALHETQAIFASMLLSGGPLWAFLYEIFALNLFMVASIRSQRRRGRMLADRLNALSTD